MSRPIGQKLPALLASLSPSSTTSSTSRTILVRPASWPIDSQSFYLLTRHSLKFPAKSAPTAKAKLPAVAKAALGGDRAGAAGTSGSSQENVGMEEVRVAGKAWGVKFWNGRPITPSPPRIPDPLIPHSLIETWTSVDPSTLSPSTRESVARVRELIKGRYEERDVLLGQLRKGKKARLSALASA